eukprot:2306989-Rhodomonas_salina.2
MNKTVDIPRRGGVWLTSALPCKADYRQGGWWDAYAPANSGCFQPAGHNASTRLIQLKLHGGRGRGG